MRTSSSQPKLAERDFIPDAWDDDSDDDAAAKTTVTSVSSMTGMADDAWDSE
jgi:hypothetical protein